MQKDTVEEVSAGVAGIGVGAVLGSSIGVAVAGTAIAGALPIAIVAGAAGWGVKKFMNQHKKLNALKRQVEQDTAERLTQEKP